MLACFSFVVDAESGPLRAPSEFDGGDAPKQGKKGRCQEEDFSQRSAQKRLEKTLQKMKKARDQDSIKAPDVGGGWASLLTYPMKNTFPCFGGSQVLGLRDSLKLRTSAGLHDKGK